MTPLPEILKNRTKQVYDFFIDLFFPIHCIECNKEGDYLCKECFSKIKYDEERKCLICNRKNKSGTICRSHKKRLNGVFVAGNYKDKILHNTIKKFKYNFIKDLTTPLGNYLSIFFLDLLNKNEINHKNPLQVLDLENTILIPVPLHVKRLRWREFNQSQLLLDEILKHINISSNSENLIRTKFNKPQAKLKKQKRAKNIINSFTWTSDQVINKNVILIDDVTTSGSTLEECAKVLKENGAKEVWGLVLARG